MELLDEISKHYADATSYHIESIRESRSTSQFRSYWQKEILRAEQAPGKRYRFEGESFSGSGIVISDGITEWNFHRTYGQYTTRTPGRYGHPLPKNVVEQDEEPIQKAFSIRSRLATVADFLNSAHFLPDETIDVGTRRIKCIVVTFGPEDLRNPFPAVRTTQTFWIDKGHKFIVKSLLVTDGNRFYDPARVPIHPMAVHTEELATYPVVELDSAIPETDFVFTPPEGSRLVDDFPLAAVVGTPANVTPRQYGMTGRMVPDLILHAADNSTLQLTSLHGHPVLIDLWATWCGPCLSEMPLIDHVFKKTRSLGLVVLGLDYDKDPKSAVEFLRRKSYDWADYHADRTGPEFPHNGLPLLVLINAEGKIVYYHNSADDEEGLIAAIRQLGPNYSAALSDESIRK